MSQLPQDPKNHKPLYDQLRELILNKIVNGEYAVLSQIPSENEFAEQFGVSRITVRQALNQLQLEGYIFKVPGKGTFVSKPKRSRTSQVCKVLQKQCHLLVTKF